MTNSIKYLIIFSILFSLASCTSLNRSEIRNAKYARVNDRNSPQVNASRIAPLIANARWQNGFKLKKGYTLLYIADEKLCISGYDEFFWHKESPSIIHGIYTIRDEQKEEFNNALQDMQDEVTQRK